MIDRNGMYLESLYMACQRYNIPYKDTVKYAEKIAATTASGLGEVCSKIEQILHKGGEDECNRLLESIKKQI